MGRRLIDLTNKRFNNLTVVKLDRIDKHGSYWLCKCDCGNEAVVRSSHLKSGMVKSCGCLRTNDLTGKKFDRLLVIKKLHRVGESCFYYLCRCDCDNEVEVRGDCLSGGGTRSCGCLNRESSTTHGMYGTRFYTIWQQMRDRCGNSNRDDYNTYGGRGIIVCDRWKDYFENFRDDMYKSYLDHCEKYGEKNTSIDRIDVNGNYEPSNCRWATNKEQNRNRRNNKIIKFNGRNITQVEASEIVGVTSGCIRQRLAKGLDIFGNPT